jgi:predicted HTH transcriptional regulator
LARGEDAQTEFKQRLPRGPALARALAALANTKGGWLLVGVDDQGRVLGLADAPAARRQIEELARTRLEPELRVEFAVLSFEDRSLLLCVVPSAPQPVRVLEESGQQIEYVRVGASTRRAQGPALRALRHGRRSARASNPLERSILEWLARIGPHPNGARVETFARERNIGLERARKAFVNLELAGAIIGSGHGKRRSYTLLLSS